MFKPNTVLVVGAGASAEVGLPLGTGLVDHIAGLVSFERDELTGALTRTQAFCSRSDELCRPRKAAAVLAGRRADDQWHALGRIH